MPNIIDAVLSLQSKNPTAKKFGKAVGNIASEVDYLSNIHWVDSVTNGTAVTSTGNPPYSYSEAQAELTLITSSGYIATQKDADAGLKLGTTQNKTLLDAMWELHRAIRGVITLPTETKAQYADRLRAMWASNST